ncbi:MAG TPA: transcriptional regulator [Clostridiales bacterium]|nr:transcriptional regulator [Clostridiales bacterium]
MSNEIIEIAQRMKVIREIAGLSCEQMAESLGISAEDYIGYETGSTDIPISILLKVSEKFNVEFTALVTGDEPRLQRYTLVRKGNGLSVNRREDYKYNNLAYNFINKKAEPFLVTVEPVSDNNPIPRNAHPGQEFNYMLEGSLKIVLNNREIILNEGDSLYFDSSLAHGMQALKNKKAVFLAIIL